MCVSLRPELVGILHPPSKSDWFRHKKEIVQFGPMRVRYRLLLLHWKDSNISLFRTLHTNSLQLSKHVKHFHTSVLLQMLFYFLNEWRNPSVLPYVILAWIPKPYAVIFNLISMYSLLLYQQQSQRLSYQQPFFPSAANSPLTFSLSSSRKIYPSTWGLGPNWLKFIRYPISLNIWNRF